MIKLFKTSVVVFFVSLNTFAQNSFAESIFTQHVIQQSPVGQFAKGIRVEGEWSVHSAFQINECSRLNLENIYQYVLLPARKINIYWPHQTVTDETNPSVSAKIQDFENWIDSELNSIRLMLNLANDPLIKGRYFCFALANFGSVNAESLGTGYLVFSPQIFFNATHLPSSTPLSMTVILMHEFAHQLQYINQEAFLFDQLPNGKKSARRLELQADCVAAALTELVHYTYLANDIRDAMKILGDFQFESESHHGTPFERAQAVNAGLEITRKFRAQNNGLSFGLNSVHLLNECRKAIR